MKLLIAVPCMDHLDVSFVRSLTALVRRLTAEGVDFEVRLRDGCLVYCARNDLSWEAISEGFTHVLWLDSDIVFEDDLLEKLAAVKREFVTGVCRSRRKQFGWCVYATLEPSIKIEDALKDEPYRVDGCGFAAVLIETRVLKAVWDANRENCFMPTQDYGEDLMFCMRARKEGFRIYAQPAARIGHVARITVRPEDARLLNEYQRDQK